MPASLRLIWDSPAPPRRAPEPFDRWLHAALGDLHRGVLGETLPPDMQALLQKLEELRAGAAARPPDARPGKGTRAVGAFTAGR